MPGELIDLAGIGASLPSRLVLDSSVVLDWLTAISRPISVPTPAQLHAVALVHRLQHERVAGLITPTGLNEVFHVVIKIGYRTELRSYQADLLAHYPRVRRHSWEHLFKARPDLIR